MNASQSNHDNFCDYFMKVSIFTCTLKYTVRVFKHTVHALTLCSAPVDAVILILACTLLLAVSGTKITDSIEAAVTKLVSLFVPALDQTVTSGEGMGRRGGSPAQDPTLQRLKAQFYSDFDLR